MMKSELHNVNTQRYNSDVTALKNSFHGRSLHIIFESNVVWKSNK